jgi:hypothetical protein
LLAAARLCISPGFKSLQAKQKEKLYHYVALLDRLRDECAELSAREALAHLIQEVDYYGTWFPVPPPFSLSLPPSQ